MREGDQLQTAVVTDGLKRIRTKFEEKGRRNRGVRENGRLYSGRQREPNWPK